MTLLTASKLYYSSLLAIVVPPAKETVFSLKLSRCSDDSLTYNVEPSTLMERLSLR
jgi:hypothetical protein